MSEWYSLYKGGTGEIEEKKSRFIASIAPVSAPEEANTFIAGIKKQYWDAKHNCSAYIIGDDGENMRSSDDGEPSGTAGRPMLEVLAGEKITNVCVVVTRYFGGTLLGTGGLVRAYQGAVKEGLKSCSILKKIKGIILKVQCEYNDFAKIQYTSSEKGWFLQSIDYGEKISINMLIEATEKTETIDTLMNITSGRALCEHYQDVTYAVIDGSPMML